jgi:hypothetical protein
MTRHLDRETNPGDGFDCACGPKRITRSVTAPSKTRTLPTVPDGAATLRTLPNRFTGVERGPAPCVWKLTSPPLDTNSV